MELSHDQDKTIHEKYLLSQGLNVKSSSEFILLESSQEVYFFVSLDVVEISRKWWQSMFEEILWILSQGYFKPYHDKI